MQAVAAIAVKTIAIKNLNTSCCLNIDNSALLPRFFLVTNMIYLDLLISKIATRAASRKIKNKLKKLDLARLFAVTGTFTNFQEGFSSAYGESEIKNS